MSSKPTLRLLGRIVSEHGPFDAVVLSGRLRPVALGEEIELV